MGRIWWQGLGVSLLAHALVLSAGWLWALLSHPEPPEPEPIQARLVAPDPEPAAPAPEPEPEPEPEPAKPATKEPAQPEPKKRIAQKAPAEAESEESAPEPDKPAPEPEEPEKPAAPQEPEPILGQGLADKIAKLAEDPGEAKGSLRQRQAVARFQEAVRSRVQANWLVPPGLEDRGDLAATVRIALTPAGELAAEPRVVASNGPGYFNSSVVRAVEKAAPFPMPDGPTQYFQNIELNFSPDMVR
jgi:membrane protein involved in colicin uptake